MLEDHLLPQDHTGERALLQSYLARQRALVHWKVDGLDDAQARAIATPSGLTIHGIVAHLTGVEKGWLWEHFAGNPKTRDRPGEFLSQQPLRELLDAYSAQHVVSDAIIARHDLDDTSSIRNDSLRWILLHLIEETARHLGHLDLLAELADSRVGEEP
ncbi:MAG: hypothetical protein JWO12_330 [Frankiales bacterium]|nr:hypothetical protein [Frankiales bacterium]